MDAVPPCSRGSGQEGAARTKWLGVHRLVEASVAGREWRGRLAAGVTRRGRRHGWPLVGLQDEDGSGDRVGSKGGGGGSRPLTLFGGPIVGLSDLRLEPKTEPRSNRCTNPQAYRTEQ